MTTVELRYLMPGATPSSVRTAAVELGAALRSLAADVPCIHQPAVTGHLDQLALTVHVQVCADGPAAQLLQVARMAVLAAAQDARLVLRPVPGSHRLVDEHADAA